MSDERVCTKCGTLTPFEELATDRRTKTGKAAHCKKCDNKASNLYYQNNKVRCNEASAKYAEEHKKEISEYQKQYRFDNKDQISAQRREYYQDNKIRFNTTAAEYAEEHKEEIAEYQKQYRTENKERLAEQTKTRNSKMLPKVRQKRRSYHRGRYRELRDQFLQALGNKCYCCKLNDIRFLTIDHVENDGQEERKPNGKGTNSYTLLKRMYERFLQEPHRYRAACYNCNCARQYAEGKICPHQQV